MIGLIILVIVCSITYSIEIIFGLGGTILMLPLLTWYFDAKTLVIYSVVPQIMVAAIGLYYSPRTVDRRFLSGMLLFAILGAAAGIAAFTHVSGGQFKILLGLAVLAAGIYLITAPQVFRIAPATGRALDVAAGFSQGLFGISGPVSMTRLLGTFTDKTIVRNAGFAFFLSLNIARGIFYWVTGSVDPMVVTMALVSMPALAAALLVANRLHFQLRQETFRRVAAWLIALGGISILLN